MILAGAAYIDFIAKKGARSFRSFVIELATPPDTTLRIATEINDKILPEHRMYVPPAPGGFPRWLLLRAAVPAFVQIALALGVELRPVTSRAASELKKAARERGQRERGPERGPRPTAASPFSPLYLTQDVPEDVAKVVYRHLAAKHHPDKGGDPEAMKRVNIAWEAVKRVRGW